MASPITPYPQPRSRIRPAAGGSVSRNSTDVPMSSRPLRENARATDEVEVVTPDRRPHLRALERHGWVGGEVVVLVHASASADSRRATSARHGPPARRPAGRRPLRGSARGHGVRRPTESRCSRGQDLVRPLRRAPALAHGDQAADQRPHHRVAERVRLAPGRRRHRPRRGTRRARAGSGSWWHPARCLQNDAKSWSPTRCAAAAFIASRSSGRGQARTCFRCNGSMTSAESAIR